MWDTTIGRAVAAGVALAIAGCGGEAPLAMRASRLVLLHTSDLHSHVFPERFVPSEWDEARGLGVRGEPIRAGGLARLGALLERERANSAETLHLDSGDLWQGTLVHELFGGEAELVAAAALGLDAQALGNHELEQGFSRFTTMYEELASFPVLAANYLPAEPSPIRPWAVLRAGQLRVGVIGVGNVDSVVELRRGELGPSAWATPEAVQSAVQVLEPSVDLIVALSHLGLDRDRELVRRTKGLDVVLGGHQHLALDEPVIEDDAAGRRVVIAHSGAYGRYLGRLSLWLSPGAGGLDVSEHEFALLPVSEGTPEKVEVALALAPYAERLAGFGELAAGLAYVPVALERELESGGDSALGNLVSDAALAVGPADLALIPSSSLRAGWQAGVLTAEALYASVPFADALVRRVFAGSELLAALHIIEEQTERWGCRTPVQISGATLELACKSGGRGSRLVTSWGEVAADGFYAVTTTRYFLATAGIDDASAEPIAETLRSAVETWLAEQPRCAESSSACGQQCASLPCAVRGHEGRIRVE